VENCCLRRLIQVPPLLQLRGDFEIEVARLDPIALDANPARNNASFFCLTGDLAHAALVPPDTNVSTRPKCNLGNGPK
jgi:hypothetical protein